MSMRRAVSTTIYCIAAALAFAAWLAYERDVATAQLFLTGYVLEYSLSIDNLMVFAALFAYFRIPSHQQPMILRWGIIGAIVFRFVFVMLGAGTLLLVGPAAGIVFGAVVIWTGVKMLTMGDAGENDDYESKWFVKLARRYSTTPWVICLIAVEISDIIFAFDSMPAIIAVVQEPLIVYSAVMFAVLGLRSLYFVLNALLDKLHHLGKAVIAVLFFVGAKMLTKSLAEFTHNEAFNILDVSPGMNLAIVLGTLSIGVLASLLLKPREESKERADV